MEGYFERILQLVQKTGDRVIVTDPSLKKAFVIMDLDQYESILSLQASSGEEGFTEEDFDLANAVEEVQPKKYDPDPTIWQVMTQEANKNPESTWDMNKLTAEERVELERAFYAHKKAGHLEKKQAEEHVQRGVVVKNPEETGNNSGSITVKSASEPVSGGIKKTPEESFYLGSVE